jgi:hypothetical protein
MTNTIKSEALRGLLEDRQADVLAAIADLTDQANVLSDEYNQITDLLTAQDPEPVVTPRRKKAPYKNKGRKVSADTRKCSICGLTGHRASNKKIHPTV